jgi:hypothetical protein
MVLCSRLSRVLGLQAQKMEILIGAKAEMRRISGLHA